jgi:hypothetical protein
MGEGSDLVKFGPGTGVEGATSRPGPAMTSGTLSRSQSATFGAARPSRAVVDLSATTGVIRTGRSGFLLEASSLKALRISGDELP